jgi:hypothetical protein
MKKPRIKLNPFADLDHLRFGQPASAALGESPPQAGENEGLVRHRLEERELAAELERRRMVLRLIDSGEEVVRCEQRLAVVGSSTELAALLDSAERDEGAGGLQAALGAMRRGGVDKHRMVEELRRRLGVAAELEQRIELLKTRPEAVRAREQMRITALEHRLEQNRRRQQRRLDDKEATGDR